LVRYCFQLFGGDEDIPLSFQLWFLAFFELGAAYLLKLEAKEFLAAGALLLVFFQGFELLFHPVEFFGFNAKVIPQFHRVGISI